MLKKILFIVLALVVLFPLCILGYRGQSREKLGIDYWPMYLDDANDYVWIDDNKSTFLINHEANRMIGISQERTSDILIIFEYGRFDGRFSEYSDDFLIIFDGNSVTNEIDGFPKDKVGTKTPVFTEDGFSVRVSEKNTHNLLSGVKKLHFTKYKKSDISPSDFGFNIENWDSILKDIKYYYYVYWDDGKWGDFYFDDYDGISSEKYLKFKALLEEGKEDEAMKLVDAFGIQGQ